MNIPQKRWLPLALIALLTIAALVISVISLVSGWQTIFQNLFYFPIILACIYYSKRGFVFSVLLACCYFALMVMFSNDPGVLVGALVRVLIFILVAGVVTYLSMIRVQAVDAQRESETRLEKIIDFLPDPTFVIDKEGKVIAWNYAIASLLGVDASEIVGKGNYEHAFRMFGHRRPVLIDLVLKEDDAVIKKHYPDLRREQDLLMAELDIPDLRGKHTVLWIIATPLYNAKGEISGAIESMRDITHIHDTEKSLRESEERHRTILQTTRDGFWMIDLPEGKLTDVNETYCRMSGYTRTELLTQHIRDLDALKTPDEQAATLNRIIANGSGIFEARHRRKDGSVFDVELSVTYQNTNGGRLICFCRDITERKVAETALKNSIALLNKMGKTAKIGGWEFYPENQEQIWTEEVYRIHGFDVTYRPKVKSVIEFYSPASRLILEHAIKRTIEYGEPFDLELEIITPNGTHRWVHAIGNADREHGKVFGVVQDITERKKADQALQESEDRYRAVADFAYDWEYWIAPGGEFIYVSPSCERITGYRPEEFALDKDLLVTITHANDRAKISDHLAVAQGLKPGHGNLEFRIITRNGEERWIGHECQPVYNNNGEYLGRRGSNRDITDRKRAEEALRQVNKKLNLLSSITRHDINNQLMSVNGFLELLHEKVPDPTLENYFTRITNASSRIESMIKFTKTYENIGVNEPTWQEIRALIDAASKDVSWGKIQIANDLPACSEIYADPLIIKVFYNLMDNATKYGGEGMTTIRFSSGESESGLVIVCEDDGAGISFEDKKHLFERGFGKNTGFGLFLSREILAITGITINETSKPWERGTVRDYGAERDVANGSEEGLMVNFPSIIPSPAACGVIPHGRLNYGKTCLFFNRAQAWEGIRVNLFRSCYG